MTLENISTNDLKAELQRREEQDLINELKRRTERAQFILDNIDAFIAAVPKHCRTSCDDIDVCNPGRCNRCDLLEAKHSGYWDLNKDIEISVIHLSPIPDLIYRRAGLS